MRVPEIPEVKGRGVEVEKVEKRREGEEKRRRGEEKRRGVEE